MPCPVDWEVISFVLSSDLRFKVLLQLNGGESTPSELAHALGAPISHVSKALHELADRELVKCLTPTRKRTRFYGITESGKSVLSEIHRVTGRRS